MTDQPEATGLTALEKFDAGSTVFSGIADIFQGFANAKVLKLAAQQELFESGNERIRGLRQENRLIDELESVLASQRVAVTASGIDVSSPVAQRVRAETVKKGERETGIVRDQTALAAEARRIRGRNLLRRAKSEKKKGIIKGGLKILTGLGKAFLGGG